MNTPDFLTILDTLALGCAGAFMYFQIRWNEAQRKLRSLQDEEILELSRRIDLLRDNDIQQKTHLELLEMWSDTIDAYLNKCDTTTLPAGTIHPSGGIQEGHITLGTTKSVDVDNKPAGEK